LLSNTRFPSIKYAGGLFPEGPIWSGEADAACGAGVHGYAHVTYEGNFPKKFAAILESLSRAEFYIASAVESTLVFCLMLQVKTDAHQWQVDMLDGQTHMLDSIRGNADLNYDGGANLKDCAMSQQKFGSMTVTQP